MKTDEEWEQEINDLYDGHKSGRIKTVAAVELNNTIGKLISLRKLKVEEKKMQFLLDHRDIRIPFDDEPVRPKALASSKK